MRFALFVLYNYRSASLALLHRKCDAGRQARSQRDEKGLTFIRVRAWLERARYGCRTDCLWPRQADRDTKKIDIYKSASVACACALYLHDRLFVTQTGRQAEPRKRFDIYKSVGWLNRLSFWQNSRLSFFKCVEQSHLSMYCMCWHKIHW